MAWREQQSGLLAADADPARRGSALFSLVLGFLLQRLLLRDVEPASYVAAVRVLFESPGTAAS